jgi:hypothetical protein
LLSIVSLNLYVCDPGPKALQSSSAEALTSVGMVRLL